MASFSSYPACAQSCLAAALSDTNCSSTDAQCLCKDSKFALYVDCCALASCDSSDLLTAASISNLVCIQYGVTVSRPPASACSTTLAGSPTGVSTGVATNVVAFTSPAASTNVPSTYNPSSSYSSSSHRSKHGISKGGKAGIGVGAALVVLAIIMAIVGFLAKRRKQKKNASASTAEAAQAAPAVVATGTSPAAHTDEKLPWAASAVPYTPHSANPANSNMTPATNWSGMQMPPQHQPEMAPPYNNQAYPQPQMQQQPGPYAAQQYNYQQPGMHNVSPAQPYAGVATTPSPITPVTQPPVHNVAEMPSSGTGVAPELSGNMRHELS